MTLSRRTFLATTLAASTLLANTARATIPRRDITWNAALDDLLLTDLRFCRHAFSFGPIRHAHFHDREIPPGITAHARLLNKALTYHLAAWDGDPRIIVTIQHDGDRHCAPQHLVLTLHHADGRRAVFTTDPSPPQADFLRFENATCELHPTHYRISTPTSAQEVQRPLRYGCETIQRLKPAWIKHLTQCPRPILDAFAKAFA